MRYAILLAAFVVYAAGSGVVFAQGCHSTCGAGYTYNSDTGTCVPKAESA